MIGLTREQVVLYEALVRESMERIERADEDARRGLVLRLLTGAEADLQLPRALPAPARGAG